MEKRIEELEKCVKQLENYIKETETKIKYVHKDGKTYFLDFEVVEEDEEVIYINLKLNGEPLNCINSAVRKEYMRVMDFGYLK